MKFHLNHDPANKTLTIPRAALQLSGLAETSDLTIHAASSFARYICIFGYKQRA